VKRAWYLGVTPGEVAARCILVGDPGRVDRFAERLQGVRLINQERGLRTVTGAFDGVPVTVSAFGMGAPIAAVVLEELAGVGARVVLRAGTAMAVGDDMGLLGSLVLAHAAVRGEATSATYAPIGYPAVADPLLLEQARAALRRGGVRYREGLLASYDGFYTELFAADEQRRGAVAARLAEAARLGVLAADMETSAVLVVGSVLGVRAGSLCLVSVDGRSRARLEAAARREGEERLVEAALWAVIAVPVEEAANES
jgi:uridine phosphorylase